MSQRPCDRFEPAVPSHKCVRCGWAKGKHRPRKQPTCATTGRFRYATESAARVALNRLMGKPNCAIEKVRQLSPRACPHCHGVHLQLEGEDNVATSRPGIEGQP